MARTLDVDCGINKYSGEFCYLVNPDHVQFAQIQFETGVSFAYDLRLIGGLRCCLLTNRQWLVV